MHGQKSAFGIPVQTSQQIRQSFVDFFTAKAHQYVPSAGLVPHDDPTILFTNSGMNQFKTIFLGHNPAGLKRAANSQKCLRVSGKHNDLDEVGRDGSHHTFFEMLGNWSFGDYYKRESILWAWDLLTNVWKFPKDRLFATIYVDDEEAFEIWRNETDIDPTHISRFVKENFWEMGETGPCGPCSEIHFDLGDPATQAATFQDPIKGVNGTDGRYMEIWNLVFMQSERLNDGSLKPLKAKHVDTGAGFERMCTVIQGKTSNYDTDVFQPLIQSIAEMSGVPYQQDHRGMPHRVIADHVRALSFAIADGATPGSEGRGYVLRRILRRASRFAYNLGQKAPFLFRLVPVLVQEMGAAYPQLKERQDYITQVIQTEEQRFLRTLVLGLVRMDKLLGQLRQSGAKEIPGKDVFLFHDTYGFPSDLTELIAQEQGLTIDHAGFEAAMEEQKERARAAGKFGDQFAGEEGWEISDASADTKFVGYETFETSVNVKRFREEGDSILLVLDRTPFYAESGGQCGDQGTLENSEVELRVVDTINVLQLRVHHCTLVRGLVTLSSLKNLTARVDMDKRGRTARNHSATHLLHASLRQILGTEVVQQGSYVGPERLRFDFSFSRGLTEDESNRVEDLVNQQILANLPVNVSVMAIAEAKKSGAVALFGEKYGDHVRVLSMGSFSKELCGGTHVKATGDIGCFKLVQESSIAAGVRRIEAITGAKVMQLLRQQDDLIGNLAKMFKVRREQLADKALAMVETIKTLEQTVQNSVARGLEQGIADLLRSKSTKVGNFSVVIDAIDNRTFPAEQLQGVLDTLVNKLERGVAVLTHTHDGQLSILVAVGTGAQDRVDANVLVKELATLADGRGGGRKDRARAGSKMPEHAGKVLALARQRLEVQLMS